MYIYLEVITPDRVAGLVIYSGPRFIFLSRFKITF